MEKRLKGVTILGIFLLVCVIPGLMLAFIGLISGPTHPQGALAPILDDATRKAFVSSPLIFLIVGIGILKLENGARILAIFFGWVSLLFVSIFFINFHIMLKVPFDLVNDLTYLAIGIFSSCVIYYLSQPKVRGQFK